MKALTPILLLVALLAVAASGQVFYTADAAIPGVAFDTYAPSAAYPVGAPSAIGPPPLPAAAGLAIGTPFGGMAIDSFTNTVYTSDGFAVAVDSNLIYSPFAPPPPPMGPFPMPYPTGAPITGLAMDSAAGILVATDGFTVTPYPLAPPFVPLAAPVPIPVALPAPISGLGYEPSTGTLWGVDLGGVVINFTSLPGPLVLLAPPIPVPLMAGLPAGGLAVNSSNGPGSFPPPFCSTQLPAPAFHIAVTDGVFVYDVLTGAPPIPHIAPSGAGAYGLAFSSDFQITFGAVGCPTTGTFPIPGMLSPGILGGPIANGLAIAFAPPATAVTMMFDVCPLPGGAALISGETLWINPLSPGFATAGLTTDAAGFGLFPLPFAILPAGVQFSVQWAVPDALAPLFFCLTDLLTITNGLP